MSSLEGLIPGIPDHVTLAYNTTKLPPGTFRKLYSVSQHWERAIQSREVYNERIRSGSSVESPVFKHRYEVKCKDPLHSHCTYRGALSLYSMSEKTFYDLPPIPHLAGDSERFCQLIASSGNLYVCSHKHKMPRDSETRANEERAVEEEDEKVYVIDLTGSWRWEECTTVPGPERKGKINCLFRADGKPHEEFLSAEHPDWCPDLFNSFWGVVDEVRLGEHPEAFFFDEVPEMSFTGDPRRFKIEPKRYIMTSPEAGYSNIYVQDTQTKLWRQHHSVSFQDIAGDMVQEASRGSLKIFPIFVVPVNNEVVAIVRWSSSEGHGYELLQSRGLGTDAKEISWEKIPHSFPVEPSLFFGMCTILL